MPHDEITFGLAAIGFALLAADAARRWRGARSAPLTRLTTVVVLAHVACVWTWRFGGSLDAMLQKGALPFVVFHGAAALQAAATVTPEPWRTRAVLGAFALVCCGALPAPFRYPELAVLRLPVVAIAATAVWYALRRRDEA